jgi:Fur family transcriptional regulator, peroxide stress response regulator
MMKRFRKTPQRLAIMKFLNGHISHPSAEDVYAAVKKQFPTLSLATVYNTLETLRERGEIVELGSDPAKRRFDTAAEPHHHLICVRCKKIVDIPGKFSPVLMAKEKMGYQVIRSQVDFHGLCPHCQSRNKARKT